MKIFCLTLMGEIGTTNVESGDIAIMVFTSEESMNKYLINWEQYASVPVEVVNMELYDLFFWLINKAPQLNSVAVDPSPDDDECRREVIIDRDLSYELSFEKHYLIFETQFEEAKKIA